MFGKCLTYEIKLTWKKMFLLYAVAAVFFIMKVVSDISFNTIDDLSPLASSLYFISNSLYSVVETALAIYTIFVLCKDYKVTMYSQRGYLTHTLPVKTMSLFWAKIINGIIWCLLTSVFQFILFIINVFMNRDNKYSISNIFFGLFEELFEQFKGTMFLPLLFVDVVLFILMIFMFVTSTYGIGQLSNNHRKGLTIGTGFAYYVIISIIINYVVKMLITAENLTPSKVASVFLIVIAVINVILYFINRATLTKYLNLQ